MDDRWQIGLQKDCLHARPGDREVDHGGIGLGVRRFDRCPERAGASVVARTRHQ